MSPFILYVATAFALVFVIEGLLYACFPGTIRQMLAVALTLPPQRLRVLGAFMVAFGFCLIGLLHFLTGS